jgi:hypothetical protein
VGACKAWVFVDGWIIGGVLLFYNSVSNAGML